MGRITPPNAVTCRDFLDTVLNKRSVLPFKQLQFISKIRFDENDKYIWEKLGNDPWPDVHDDKKVSEIWGDVRGALYGLRDSFDKVAAVRRAPKGAVTNLELSAESSFDVSDIGGDGRRRLIERL